MDLKCKRCGHEWISKFDKKPKVCCKCKSQYWEKELTPYWKALRERNEERRNMEKD